MCSLGQNAYGSFSDANWSTLALVKFSIAKKGCVVREKYMCVQETEAMKLRERGKGADVCVCVCVCVSFEMRKRGPLMILQQREKESAE